MKKQIKKNKDLSSFERFKLENLKVILGGTGNSDGGIIDPPAPKGMGNGPRD